MDLEFIIFSIHVFISVVTIQLFILFWYFFIENIIDNRRRRKLIKQNMLAIYNPMENWTEADFLYRNEHEECGDR